MLETVERISSFTATPLAAQPNAGRPRDVEGRNLYLTSPEYMASYARRFIASGVRLVGGCCGTTPEHIRQIKAAVIRAAATAAKSSSVTAPAAVAERSVATVPLGERSKLAAALAAGRFVRIVELRPPRGYVSDTLIEQARALERAGIDAVNISEGARGGARMSALALAVLVQQHTAMETVLQYSCRDRNLLGMQSDLLGAHAMGLRNLVLVTGDVKPVGDIPDATVVFDVDSIGLTNVVRRLNEGLDIGGQAIGAPTAFHIGVHLNPGADDLDNEIRRFEFKVEAGAEFAVTGPIFDLGTFERLYRRIEGAKIPLVVGVWPFESALNAEFMANEVPGVRVNEEVLDRMRKADAKGAAPAEGVAIARELVASLRGTVQGVHVAAPGGRCEAALEAIGAAV